jgi:uncharacterized protein YndB with AHSA1/START domain
MPHRTTILLLALASGAFAATEHTPTGDVEVEMVAVGPGMPRQGIGTGVIEAAPERVFRALTDYLHWEEFVPFLDESDAIPREDGTTLSHHRMSFPFPLGERRYAVSARHSAGAALWRLEWSYLPGSGNVRDHRGSWVLTPLPDGRTLAVCRLFTDPGGAIPLWAVDRGTQKTLPWIFHGLRQHVRRARYDLPALHWHPAPPVRR